MVLMTLKQLELPLAQDDDPLSLMLRTCGDADH